MFKCPYCEKMCLHIQGINGHIGNIHSNKNQSQIMKNIWSKRKELYSYNELKNKYWLNHHPPSHKGESSKRKGRTNIEMLGEIRAKQVSEKIKQFMYKNRFLYPEKYNKGCFISKGQQLLYEVVKQKYSQSILNYQFSDINRHYIIDIFIPELNIGIEYNGCYYHGCRIHFSDEIIKYNNTMYRLGMLNNNFLVIPVWECMIKKEKDMKNWFNVVEEIINNRGEDNGKNINTSLSN